MANQQSTHAGLRELALFAGAGGGILGGKLLGWETVCAVEWGEYPASVLCARQNEGLLPPFPIWDDVQTFDGRPWRGIVDVVSGGFPCQDISVAGKGAGIDGERSGMWSHMARIIGEVRPRFAFVENSPALISRGLGRVLGDLAALGYDCRWGVLRAADVGANHQRDRFWLVATDTLRHGCGQRQDEHVTRQHESAAHVGPDGAQELVADAIGEQPHGCRPWSQQDGITELANDGQALADAEYIGFGRWEQLTQGASQAGRCDSGWWATEPDVGRVASGVPARVDRIKSLGNAQVPLCAATAWRLLGANSMTKNTIGTQGVRGQV